MKKVRLTQGKFALVDDEDFEKISKFNWSYGSNGYAVRSIYIKGSGRLNQKNIMILMHRIINKTPAKMITDHINRNKLDNRKVNLRTVTNSQNIRNTGLRKTNTSGFKGITFDRFSKSWRARLKINYKVIDLGRFKDKIKAAIAYEQAVRKYVC